jgi:hypothetical protein
MKPRDSNLLLPLTKKKERKKIHTNENSGMRGENTKPGTCELRKAAVAVAVADEEKKSSRES